MHLKYLCLLTQLKMPNLSTNIYLLWLVVTAFKKQRRQQAPLEDLQTAQRNTPLAAKNIPPKHISDTLGSLLSLDIL